MSALGGTCLVLFVLIITISTHFLLLPITIFIPIANLHAFLTSRIQAFFLQTILWYFHNVLNIKIKLTGDGAILKKSDKKRLIISNHPTTIDWIWWWFVQHRDDDLGNMRFVMNADQASFKTVPILGQIVEQFVHLFLVKKSSNSGERCKRAIKRTILYRVVLEKCHKWQKMVNNGLK